MKIIIIGEFSGFAKNLSKGFQCLGHDSFVFSWGDSYREIKQDGLSYFIKQKRLNLNNPINILFFLLSGIWESLKLRTYIIKRFYKSKVDAVIILNPTFIRRKGAFWSPYFSKRMVQSMVKNKEMVFLSACGSDVPYYTYWKGKGWKNDELVNSNYTRYAGASDIKHHYYIASFVNKVIPTIYSYAEAWRKSDYSKGFKVMPTVLLPVATSLIKVNNVVNSKIVIFHGITRPEIKGTKYILEAMKMIEKKYPDKVECHATGGLPLEEYLKLMEKTNISIDQALECGPGMNAIFSLAQGKVVFGGNTIEQQKEVGINDNPTIEIGPDSKQIFCELERFVQNPKLIKEVSIKSREYVVKYHDSKVIAQKYIDIFNSVNNNIN